MDGLMLRLLIVFFLDMFCKLVFCKLENMRWPSNIPEISNRSVWSKWLKPPYIYGTHWHKCHKKGHSSYQKYQLTKMAPTINGTTQNDISQLTLLSRVLARPWISLEAIATLKSGQRGNFWRKFQYISPSLSTERETTETVLSIKSRKKLVSQLKFDLVRKKSLVKQMKLKSQSHSQKSTFFTVTKFSDYKKSGKFLRKSLVTIPILKGYMVPEA